MSLHSFIEIFSFYSFFHRGQFGLMRARYIAVCGIMSVIGVNNDIVTKIESITIISRHTFMYYHHKSFTFHMIGRCLALQS